MQTSHDQAKRRKAKRSGRERGCWAYIPAELLREAGFTDLAAPVFYRIWPAPGRPRFVVNLYREP